MVEQTLVRCLKDVGLSMQVCAAFTAPLAVATTRTDDIVRSDGFRLTQLKAQASRLRIIPSSLCGDVCNQTQVRLMGGSGTRTIDSSKGLKVEPLVSIIIPCYNSGKWVGEAIQSALDQTWPHKEIIVIDDGSTDGSLDVIKGFGDRIQWKTGPNRGGNIARNRGLELARGQWLQYLDADDYLLPQKVAHQMDFLSQRPEVDIAFSPVMTEYWAHGNNYCELIPIPEPHDLWVLLARWYLPQTGASLWRKQAITDVGGWKPDQPCCQEHELYLRLLMAGKRLAYCPSNGAVYRQWSEGTVCRRDKVEVRKQRLEIEQRVEDFLRKHGELTASRQWAINMARFELARTAWQQDHLEGYRIMHIVDQSQDDFLPAGQAAPGSYRLVFRLFGFGLTQRVADVRRHFLASLRTG